MNTDAPNSHRPARRPRPSTPRRWIWSRSTCTATSTRGSAPSSSVSPRAGNVDGEPGRVEAAHMMSLRRQSERKSPPKWSIAVPASFAWPCRSSHTEVASRRLTRTTAMSLFSPGMSSASASVASSTSSKPSHRFCGSAPSGLTIAATSFVARRGRAPPRTPASQGRPPRPRPRTPGPRDRLRSGRRRTNASTRRRNAGTPASPFARAQRPTEPDQALPDIGHLPRAGARHPTAVVNVVDAAEEVGEVEPAQEGTLGRSRSRRRATRSRPYGRARRRAVDLVRRGRRTRPGRARPRGRRSCRRCATRGSPARAGESTGPATPVSAASTAS